jgi:hypothetical protein
LEAKPAGVTKAHAVEAFLDEPPFAGRTPSLNGIGGVARVVDRIAPALPDYRGATSRRSAAWSASLCAPCA